MKCYIEHNGERTLATFKSFSDIQDFVAEQFKLEKSELVIEFPLPSGQGDVQISSEEEF